LVRTKASRYFDIVYTHHDTGATRCMYLYVSVPPPLMTAWRKTLIRITPVLIVYRIVSTRRYTRSFFCCTLNKDLHNWFDANDPLSRALVIIIESGKGFVLRSSVNIVWLIILLASGYLVILAVLIALQAKSPPGALLVANCVRTSHVSYFQSECLYTTVDTNYWPRFFLHYC